MIDFNLDDEHWLRFITTTVYLNWLQAQLNYYSQSINKEVHRTGKLPTMLLKNYRAFLLEHNQKLLAQDITKMLNDKQA